VQLTWPLTGRSEEMRAIEAATVASDVSGIVVCGAAGSGRAGSPVRRCRPPRRADAKSGGRSAHPRLGQSRSVHSLLGRSQVSPTLSSWCA
jgi:hypothetical protein